MDLKLAMLFDRNSKNGKINPRTIARLVRENKWIVDNFYSRFKAQEDLFETFGKFLLAEARGIELRKCQCCGKTLSYDETVRGATYCSNRCKLSSYCNPFSREDIKAKIKKTLLSRLGVDNPAKSQEVQSKIVKTCLERYGSIFKQSEEIKLKIKKTHEARYGMFYSKTSEYKERVLKTNFERYGVKHKNIINAWNKISNSSLAEPMFTLEEFARSNHKKDFLRWRCKDCGAVFYSRWDNGYLTSKCKCHFKNPSANGSSGEKELLGYVISLGLECVSHYKLPGALEIDIYVPSLKLGFEFNGSYWHSLANGHGNGYHLNKTLCAEASGIHLVHVWEDEWKAMNEVIKKKIKDTVEGRLPEVGQKVLVLDRCWFSSKTSIPGYAFKGATEPKVVVRESNEVEDCGSLVFEKV